MKRLFLALLLIAPLAVTSAQDDTDVSAAEAAATDWLSLTDGGQYVESWQASSSFFRAAITAEDWTAALEGARASFGALNSRETASAQYSTSLPGAPDGEYVVFEFNASFVNKQRAVETVTVMRDLDGTWRVAGYFIR